MSEQHNTELKFYTTDHEWIIIQDNVATIGITNYAQESLGEVVYVDLPEVGSEHGIGETFATIESVKAASDVYAPLTGEVVAINDRLEDEPELVNSDAESAAWFVKIRVQQTPDSSQWLNQEDYIAAIDE